jgi:S1-C subfamily serine protease
MWVTIIDGKRAGISLKLDGTTQVGREADNSLVLDDERVSKHHARLTSAQGGVELVDLNSTNGTYVNGQRVTGTVMVQPGDTIRVGQTTLRVDSSDPAIGNHTVVGAAPAAAPRPPAARSAPSAPPSNVPGGVPAPPPGSSINVAKPSRTPMVLGVAVVAVIVLVIALVVRRDGGGDDTSALVDAVRDGTVLITADIAGQLQGTGTGWVLDASEGLIVTNSHVINAGTSFNVGTGSARRAATLVAAAPCEDLAILRVNDRNGLRGLRLGSQDNLRQGERVIALGYPVNASVADDLSVTEGIVSIVRTRFDQQALDVPRYPNVIQTDAAINPGNSGGPLFNTRREVIGVNSAGITLQGGRIIQGQGYAIGIDRVKEIATDLRAGRSHAWLGMNFEYATQDADFTSRGFRQPIPGAIIVTSAVPLSPAANAGFGQQPVALVAIDGRALDGTLGSYCDVVGSRRAGDRATFTVVTTANTTGEITVTFG